MTLNEVFSCYKAAYPDKPLFTEVHNIEKLKGPYRKIQLKVSNGDNITIALEEIINTVTTDLDNTIADMQRKALKEFFKLTT